jgi:hypothetical protein
MSDLHTEEILPIQCGVMSLIGACGEKPLSWGNYFWLRNGPRVANFWWENLEAADKKFKLDGQVKVRRYQLNADANDKRERGGDWCLIDDDRIPKEWYHNKLCFTGGWPPSIEILQDMYSYLGDPDNELLQYTDPKTYWEAKGGSYNNGVITMKLVNDSGPIKYKSKNTMDAGLIYCPYIPKVS